jgi:hypothetical protein
MLLVWRFFKKGWPVQLAVALLLASAVTVFALYGAYLDRQSALLGVRIESAVPEGVLLVISGESQHGPNPPMPYRGSRPAPVEYSLGWQNRTLDTSIGSVKVAVLDRTDNPFLQFGVGEVAVPRSLALTRGLEPGDTVLVHNGGGFNAYSVSSVHDEPLFRDSLVLYMGPNEQQTHFLYAPQASERPEDVLRYMRRLYPGASILDVHSSNVLARNIIAANYSPGAKARVELISFVTLAFLSASLLAFLERRKVLAILKAMGLRSNELARIIAGEGLLAPVLGALSGGLFSALLLWWLEAAGMGVSPTVQLMVVSVLSIVPAALIGIMVPARFAQVATVNQLLLEQPIPLMHAEVRGLRRRWPALEPMMEKGIKFVKLEMVQGHFQGFIFRKEGDMVKEGEVLAVSTEWWGLRVKEYLSPATGEIVFFNTESGFFGVQDNRARQMEVHEHQ